MRLYWQLGRDIFDQQGREGWGAKVADRLAHNLKAAFLAPKFQVYAQVCGGVVGREFVQQLLHKLRA